VFQVSPGKSRPSRALRYLAAVAAAAVCVWVRSLFVGTKGDALGLLPFAPAVLVGAWYGGLWPGVLATVLGMLAGN
jgi:hypothetical protein